MRADARRNRARILAAARDLIASAGPDVPIEAIAAAAGVAVGTVYRHHPTKADLVAAVFDERLGQVAAKAEAAIERVAAGASAGEELTRLVSSLAEENTTDQAMRRAGAQLGARHPDNVTTLPEGSPGRRAGDGLTAILRAAQAAGDVRPDVTLDDLAILLGGTPAEPERRRRYLDIMLAGLRN